MSASSSRQSIIDIGTSAESKEKDENVNKELLQAIEEIYSPLLKVMKIFGAYFGHINFSSSLVQTSGLMWKTELFSSPLLFHSGCWFVV